MSLSPRRSTRERKKPTEIYEVEDRRNDEEDDAAENGGEQSDEDEAENDDDDGESGDEDDDDDDDFKLNEPRKSANAAKTPAKKRGRPANAQPKHKTLAKPRKLKPVSEEGRQSTKPRAPTATQSGENEEEGGDDDDGDDDFVFEAIKRGNCSMTDLVIEWRERFEQGAEPAIREVLNFVLHACGGQGQCVPPTEQLEKLDMSDLVDYVVEDLEKSNDGYPIATKVKAFKKFQANFVAFWDAFIQECYDSELMFTTEIVDQFVDWLTTLSSAEVRAIRHTTTVAAYAIGNALVDCTNKLTQQLSVIQRQVTAESASSSKKGTKSPRNSAASKKLEQLKENKAMYLDRQKKLLELVQLLFNGVVVHRYRDVMPEIRAASVRVLGNWITVVPDQFLKDNYLKYLGWVLNDKDPHVRVGVVEMLRQLYENETLAEKMELFTSRFLARFLELCNDVDDNVVEACIKLLIAVDKRSLISSEVELHSVERLVFEENNEVIRKNAAEFVCLQYDAFGVAESNRNAKLTKEQLNTQAIALVEFAEEYITNHQVPADAVETMVDAFWGLDDCQVLQDWKLLTGLVLADKNAPDLTSEQQTLLLRLLVASVGKISCVDSEKSNAAAKKKLAKEKEELCVTFCREIPTMLVRFQSDVEKLALVVELIPFLALDGEVSGLQPAHVKSLLEKLQHAYTAHSEVGLLKSLSLSIHHLRQSRHEVIKRESDVIIHELLQDVLDKLEESLEEDEKLSAETTSVGSKRTSIQKRNSKKRDVTDSEYAVRTALTRLECLITHVCVREFLPQTLSQSGGNTSSPPSGKKKRPRQTDSTASTEVSVSNRMEALTSSLVRFVRRRSTKVTEMDAALLEAESIKLALSVLFSDVLWLTRPVFSSAAEQAANAAAGTTTEGEIVSQIDGVCTARLLLEEAITSVLEMHLNKVGKVRTPDEDGDEEMSEEPQIEMEEIVFEDPKAALFVKVAQRGAFLIFCDARCLFVEKFKDAPAPYDKLDWSLPKVLVLLTQMYFENEMEATDDQPEGEDDDDDAATVKKDQSSVSERAKAEILVALGRVSHSNPSNKRQAAAVLRYLVDGGHDSQEVVRAFARHIKADAPVRYLEVQMTALRQVFGIILGMNEEYESAEDDEATQEELEANIASSEAELKELAKKLSQSLGVGKVASSLRAPFFRFVCEGVRYALERPAQFSFLDVLRPYLSHLDKPSIKQLNAHFRQMLEKLGDDVPGEEDDIDHQWKVVFEFQSLISNADGVVRSASAAKALKRKVRLSVTSTRADEEDELRSQVGPEADENDETDADAVQATRKRKSRDVEEASPAKRLRVSKGTDNVAAADADADADADANGTATAVPATSTSLKRKLTEEEEVEEETASKRSRPARTSQTPRRASSGRITQLSDDEDDEDENEDEEEEEEKVVDAQNAKGAEDAADDVESEEEEIASRQNRRRGRK